ncbi:MAG: four helix bundle suffix domain-containing protein [Paramuribaculum sp.]|nr:four helix bundle suffix domain-containing protein [Paramuribaculum sp.]
MTAFLKVAGDYANWNVYKKSVIICDVTEMFITRALPRGSRTIDQMRQAARSCKQNIVEGVSDATVSAEMCIKLLGVARGSVRELREDYADYLRQHKFEIWPVDDPRTVQLRRYTISHYDSRDYVDKCENRTNETVANIMLTLTYQMDAMLAKVLKSVEAQFVAEGGIKEAMSRARREQRGY